MAGGRERVGACRVRRALRVARRSISRMRDEGARRGRGDLRLVRRAREPAMRRDDAHRDDVLQRLVDGHLELAHGSPGHHHEVSPRGIGRRGHVDTHKFVGQVIVPRPRVSGRNQWSSSGPRKLDEQRLAKRRALVRKHRIADLLDRQVDRFHERDPAENASQMRISRWPKKFAAKMPVRRRIANLRSAPRSGMWNPTSASGRHVGGTSSSDWSSIPTSAFSTQIVMPSGTHTSSPAIR